MCFDYIRKYWAFYSLFGIEFVGAIILLFATPAIHDAVKNGTDYWLLSVLFPLISGILLIQFPFWLRKRWKISPPSLHPFTSLVWLFCGRIYLIIIGVIFTTVAFSSYQIRGFSFSTIAILLMLFSIFCFTKEIEDWTKISTKSSTSNLHRSSKKTKSKKFLKPQTIKIMKISIISGVIAAYIVLFIGKIENTLRVIGIPDVLVPLLRYLFVVLLIILVFYFLNSLKH